MTNPLADIRNLTFIDFETRALPGASSSDANLKTAGTYRYVKNAYGIILTGCEADAPVWSRAVEDFNGGALRWRDMPHSLHAFHERVMAGTAWYAAFNAGFDREVWNEATYDFPRVEPEHFIDIMAQATASNLPPALEGASRAISRHGKQQDGKRLISMFCGLTEWSPQTHPEDWERFVSYAVQDTAELREVYRHTRPLSVSEWEDYWVSERINRRGVSIDLPFVTRAAAVAEADSVRSNKLISAMTGGKITTLTQAARIAEWVYDRIEHSEARELLVSEWNEDAEDDLVVGKLSLERQRVASVLAFYAHLDETEGLTDTEVQIVDMLTLREFGASTSPFKFAKMLRQHDDGKLKGQYVFNGAAQTGRFSSKGVQIHNLIRASLERLEVPAIEMIYELEV
ncbi:MAG: hypothetical protein WAT79_04935 [Saprospiraceae bacterium]